MAGIFTKRIWQLCICQPNELKREIKKKTGEAMAHPGPPLEPPLEAGCESREWIVLLMVFIA